MQKDKAWENETNGVSILNGDLLDENDNTDGFHTFRVAYDAMRQGKLFIVNETMLGIAIDWIIPLLPRRMVLKMVRKMQSKT